MSNLIVGFIFRLVVVIGAVVAYSFLVHDVFDVDVTNVTRLLAIPVAWIALKVFNVFWGARAH